MLRGWELVDGMLIRGLSKFGGRRAWKLGGHLELALIRFKKRYYQQQ